MLVRHTLAHRRLFVACACSLFDVVNIDTLYEQPVVILLELVLAKNDGKQFDKNRNQIDIGQSVTHYESLLSRLDKTLQMHAHTTEQKTKSLNS